MYHPWQPKDLFWAYPDDRRTLPELFRLSSEWVAAVIDAKARSAKAATATQHRMAIFALDKIAFGVGQRAAMDAAIASATEGAPWRSDKPAAHRSTPTPWRDSLRWWIGRRVRSCLHRIAQPLRWTLRQIDRLKDRTYGW
jgi:hypothetical protein